MAMNNLRVIIIRIFDILCKFFSSLFMDIAYILQEIEKNMC